MAEAKRERFRRSAKAYTVEFLEQKKKACLNYARMVAGAAAVVNLVPVPGVGIVADLTAVTGLLIAIRRDFHLTDLGKLDTMASLHPVMAPAIADVIKAASQGGAEWVLRRFGVALVASQVSDFVPVVGQAIAASLSFGVIYMAAKSYIEICAAVARKAIEEHLDLS